MIKAGVVVPWVMIVIIDTHRSLFVLHISNSIKRQYQGEKTETLQNEHATARPFIFRIRFVSIRLARM